MELKGRIEKIITKRGVTMKQLASDIGMSEANIYKCFKRDSMESKYLVKIAERLRVRVSYLLGENDDDSEYTKGKTVPIEKFYEIMDENRSLHNKVMEYQEKYGAIKK